MDERELQLEGIVDSVLFLNEENGYTVLELDANDTPVIVVGEIGRTEEGEQLIVRGTWETHPRHGAQFHAHYWERKLPEEAINIQKYLSSGAIKGIGPSLSRKIVDHFGDRTLEIMMKEPTRLMEIKGISPKKCDAIAEEMQELFALRGLMQFLSAYQIRSHYAMCAYKKWGAGATDLLAANPYLLCAEGIELDFPKADAVAMGMEFAKNAPQRIQAGIVSILQMHTSKGYTCLPKDKLLPAVCSYLKVEEADVENAMQSALQEMTIYSYTKKNREYIYPASCYIAERYIADRIQLMVDFSFRDNSTDYSKQIAELELEHHIEYAQRQKEAISTALSRGMVILTGGPGTGKTTTLNGIISLYEKQGKRVFITAPTGRAASRVSDLTGYDASTIHRILGVSYDMAGQMRFLHDEKNTLPCDVMVIDEMSMVDVLLFEALLRALRLGCRLVMVGDCDQLPSVGPGNLLHDFIDSGKIPVVSLVEIFRQAEQSSIVTNAHKIVHGEYPDLTRKDSDCFFFQRLQANDVKSLMADLIRDRLPNAYGYHPMSDIQVITPSRKGNLGTVELNTMLQKVLNPPSRKKAETKSKFYTLREGDKIMQIKNNYDIQWHKDGESGMGIFNGDIGYIRTIRNDVQEALLEFDGRAAVYTFDQLNQIEPAYAVTVHKSQGSEFQAVIIPLLGGFQKLYYRNLLYTAVTRAKKLLILVGSQHVIWSMVDNNRRTNRYTCLQDMLTNSEKEDETFSVQTGLDMDSMV